MKKKLNISPSSSARIQKLDKADKQNINLARKVIIHEKWEMQNRNSPISRRDSEDRKIIKVANKIKKHEEWEIKERHKMRAF